MPVLKYVQGENYDVNAVELLEQHYASTRKAQRIVGAGKPRDLKFGVCRGILRRRRHSFDTSNREPLHPKSVLVQESIIVDPSCIVVLRLRVSHSLRPFSVMVINHNNTSVSQKQIPSGQGAAKCTAAKCNLTWVFQVNEGYEEHLSKRRRVSRHVLRTQMKEINETDRRQDLSMHLVRTGNCAGYPPAPPLV